MKRKFGPLILCACLAFLPMAGTVRSARAQTAEEFETVRVNQEQVDFYLRNINEAQKEMSEAMRIAVAGKVGEFQKWRDLAAKVDRYEQVFGDRIPEIDRCVRNMIEAIPSTRLPSIEISDPFTRYLESVEKRIEEIRVAENDVSRQIAFINLRIAELNIAIVDGVQEAFGEMIEGFLPSEAGLAGKGGVVVFSAWFGPPGIAVGLLAVGVTSVFNQFVNVYYTTSALADQVKIINDFNQTLRERVAALEEIRASYQPALQEMQNIDQELKSHKARFDALRNRLEGLVEGWRGLAGDAVDRKGEKLEEDFEKGREHAAEADPVALTWSWYHVGWGAPGPEPIEAREYVPEADAFLEPVLAAYRQAVESGDPKVFFDAEERAADRAADSSQQARDAADGVQRSFESAVATYQAEARAASATYSSTVSSLASRHWAGQISWSSYQSGRNAAWARYREAIQAAAARVTPSATALVAARREVARRDRVRFSFYEGSRRARSMLHQHAALLCHQFRGEQEAWERRRGILRHEYFQALGRLPDSWTMNNTGRFIMERLEGNIQEALTWTNPFNRGTPAQLKERLEATLASVEETEARYGHYRPEAERARNEVNRMGGEALRELNSFLDLYAPLMEIAWDWQLAAHHWYGDKARNTRDRLNEVFREIPPPEPAPDFSAWKAEIRRVMGTLDEWLDWVEFYEGRRDVAAHRISSRSGPLLGLGVYSLTPSVADYLDRKPEWRGLSARIDRAVPAEGRISLFTGRPLPAADWDALPPRGRLVFALGGLQWHARELFRHYERWRELGSFVGVNQGEYDKLAERWRNLSAVSADFDAAFGEEHEKAVELLAGIREFREPVDAAYRSMPAWLRRSVSHGRFANGASRLASFVSSYTGQIAPVGSLVSSAYLEGIFRDYETDYEAWQEEQRWRREEEERRRREAEEAERRRREAEEAERRAAEEARAALTATVESFYGDFARVYARRDARGVVALIDRGWTAADGSNLADLEETLTNSFRIFDEVSCTITGLAAEPMDGGRARVTYNIAIVGRIHRTRIRHEENSTVTEIVSVADGRVRILQTLSGSYWQH